MCATVAWVSRMNDSVGTCLKHESQYDPLMRRCYGERKRLLAKSHMQVALSSQAIHVLLELHQILRTKVLIPAHVDKHLDTAVELQQ